MANTSRRSFSKKSAITMAGAGLYLSMPNRLYGSNAPSDRINIGVVGMGFGVTDMRYMLEGNKSVHCVALCDVDQIRLEAQNKFLKERFPDNAGNINFILIFANFLRIKISME